MKISEFDSEGVIAAFAVIVVVMVLTYGMTSCSYYEAGLKKVCIEAGGSVIPDGPIQFRCVEPKVKP